MENDQKSRPANDKPLWIVKEPGRYCRYEKLLVDTYRKDQVIVFFKQVPKPEDIEEVKKSFAVYGYDPRMIKVRRCDNCNIPVVLFEASNLHTTINTEGVKAGPGTSVSTVGEEYSLNFFNNVPNNPTTQGSKYQYKQDATTKKKDTVVVAVLDTGIDRKLVDPKYIWQSSGKPPDAVCYKDVASGWNFLNDTADFGDNNTERHGSIVSQYIINEFQRSPYNSVQIMPLKTHDENGVGDLFSIICAIHFAIAKGANMINASWGFYSYYQFPIPYLQQLISVTLKEKGIVFVTASGNKVETEDDIAKQIYFSEFGIHLTAAQLRNLEIHNFYPAHLSSDKNSVITVTTTDGRAKISSTQNYSNTYADLGVLADEVDPVTMQMKFKPPFPGAVLPIPGSSFATAIATGVIGAYTKKGSFIPNIDKAGLFANLTALGGTAGIPTIIFTAAALAPEFIKNGKFTKKLS